MRLRFFFLLIIGLLLTAPLDAQEVVIHEDLKGDTLKPTFGMNRKHYRHSFLGSHFFLGNSEGPSGKLRTGLSWAMEYGIRYKRRFNNVFSGGIEWSVKRLAYIPSDWGMAVLPYEEEIRKERLVLIQTGPGIYQRINFQKRRGDFIGRFLDLGVYGYWNFSSRHVYSYDNARDERVKVKTSRLSYIQPFDYGVLARLGFNNFVIRGSYRFSDHFKENSGMEEFPRFSLGLELGLHPK